MLIKGVPDEGNQCFIVTEYCYVKSRVFNIKLHVFDVALQSWWYSSCWTVAVAAFEILLIYENNQFLIVQFFSWSIHSFDHHVCINTEKMLKHYFMPLAHLPKFGINVYVCTPNKQMYTILYISTYGITRRSAEYMRQSIRSAKDQIMPCRLIVAKPLSKPMHGCC